MKGCWLFLLLVLILTAIIVNPSKGSSPSFPIALEIGSAQSEKPNFDEIVSKFRVLVHLYPFLLDRYLQSGYVLLVNEVRETTDAIDQYLSLMGKAVANDLQKEMFAKVMAGSQSLKKNVETTLLAIDRYRIIKLVFDERADRLLEWLRVNSIELSYPTGGNKADLKKESMQSMLDKVKADVLRSVFATQFSLQRPADESRRNRTESLWESTLKTGKRFADSAVSQEKKRLIAFLNPTLKSLDSINSDLFVRTDELRRAWEDTLSQVESLEELLSGASAPQTTSPSGKKATPESKP